MDELTTKLEDIMQRVHTLEIKSSPNKRLFREIIDTYGTFTLIKKKSHENSVCVAESI